jgi:hypothetical protein
MSGLFFLCCTEPPAIVGFVRQAGEGCAMKVQGSPTLRFIEGIFALAMMATYFSLAAGLLCLLDARPVSLVALIGSMIGAIAALAFFVLSYRGLRRSL